MCKMQKRDPEVIHSYVMGSVIGMENEERENQHLPAISCILRVQGNNVKK